MIPPSSARPFGRPSPSLTEADLAKLIARTIQAAAAAHHEQGWAAVSIGCDGRRRTTMFDGSACQTAGEVCIATRQDGVSACIDTPTQGNGLTSQSIVFKAAACTPVTGWYVLDDEGYLYRIPADLVTAVSYWPVAATPQSRRYDLVRSGTWAALMCGDPLTPPTDNDEGGSVWGGYTPSGEDAVVVQAFKTLVGGLLTHLVTLPSVAVGTNKVTVSAHSALFAGVAAAQAGNVDVSLTQQDRNSASLTSGQEYRATVYAQAGGSGTISLGVRKGLRALVGTGTLPALLSPYTQIPLAEVIVYYTGTPITSATVASTTPLNLSVPRQLGSASPNESLWAYHGLVLRDADLPNPGVRGLAITLPSAESGVVSGSVRVAFGYPFALEFLTELIDTAAPFGLSSHTLEGSRIDYDMALVYGPARLGIEYAPYHLNVQGPDISHPEDWDSLDDEGKEDLGANIIELPNGEVALSASFNPEGTPIMPQMFDRYRVRPAPDTAPTVAVAQTALGSYGDDPNVWATYAPRTVVNWTAGDEEVTSIGSLPAFAWTHGRDLPVAVWQSGGAQDHWSQDPDVKFATIGEPDGLTCPLTFASGGCPTLQAGKTCRVSYLGPQLVVQYGWTFRITGSSESALSPLSPRLVVVPTTATYDLTVTIPLGPTGTDERTLYRFVYDRETYRYHNGSTTRYASPWDSRTELHGAVYDRMCASVVTISDNVTTEWIDDQTAIAFTGTRPPQPFIPAGAGITLDTRRRVYALPPLNL